MENKMGTMEMKKLIVTMSVPIMISMLIQALYNIVDSMFVARISNDALSAVSLCYPVQMIIVAIACGSGVGINALLSRFLGQKDPENASQVAMHGILLSLVNWIVFAILGIFCSRLFLALFTQNEEILSMGISYMQICTLFSFGVFVQITYERIMQSIGNAFYNMIIQGAGALINSILDPIFIFGMFGLPKMGVAGAAIATVIGQCAGMALGIYITYKKIHEIKISLKRFSFSFELLRKILFLALPAMLMQSIMSFMTVFINLILSGFSVLAVSVFSIYYKLQQFVFMALLGMSNAIIPIISYNYGALKTVRVKEAIRFSLIISVVIMLLGTILFQLFPEALLALFDADQAMLEIGIPTLRIISLSFVFAGISIILCSVFQALDHPYESLAVTLLRQLVLLVPLVYVLSRMKGINAGWYAFLITEAVVVLISLFFLKKIYRSI